mgnify:CR=1 FL=1
MRIEKIKAMSIVELQKEFTERKTKLNTYLLDIKSGKEKNTAKAKEMKKDIARILTIINLKTMAGEVAAAVAAQAESATKTVKADTVEIK